MTDPPPAMQREWELRQLLDLYEQRQPQRVLEVGVGFGGTLYYWLKTAPALVVAIDDNHVNRHRYEDWTPPVTQLVVVTGESASDHCFKSARAWGSFDWVFIDADHHATNVHRDWLLYGSLAAKGGIVAFHDIAPSEDPTIEVAPLWEELKTRYRTVEYVEPGGFGIGVVLL